MSGFFEHGSMKLTELQASNKTWLCLLKERQTRHKDQKQLQSTSRNRYQIAEHAPGTLSPGPYYDSMGAVGTTRPWFTSRKMADCNVSLGNASSVQENEHPKTIVFALPCLVKGGGKSEIPELTDRFMTG